MSDKTWDLDQVGLVYQYLNLNRQNDYSSHEGMRQGISYAEFVITQANELLKNPIIQEDPDIVLGLTNARAEAKLQICTFRRLFGGN